MSEFRVQRLRDEHRQLSMPLLQERLKVRPDAYLIHSLQRRKLEVADELATAVLGLVPITARFGQR